MSNNDTCLRPLRLALAGMGTVGFGVVQTLAANADIMHARTRRALTLPLILVYDIDSALQSARQKLEQVDTHTRTLVEDLLKSAQFFTDMDEFLAATAAEADVVVELMGGIDAPFTLIDRALDMGKHVVTANKALLAEKGGALFEKAAAKDLCLLYEASVAGAIPIVQTLKESLAGNRISAFMGILNGTSNYILSEMTNNGLDFATALGQAQAKGYAEADPTLDIDGHDAAHKLALLIRLAFGVEYPYADLPVQGIRGLHALDISFAQEFGYRIKLLAQAREEDGRLSAGVFPTLVHHSLLLASVGGAYNALRVEGNAVGSLFLHGWGAGALPTSSAVLGDVLTIARRTSPNTMPHTMPNIMNDTLRRAHILPPEKARSCYYMRVMVHDTAGVLRDIAGAMAAERISIAQVIQKPEEDGGVPLIFMTHEAPAQAIEAALTHVKNMGLLCADAVYYRVLG